MKPIVTELKPLLEENEIKFREENDSLFIELPNCFGELKIYDLDGKDDIVGLVGSDWHTHSESLGNPNTKAKNIIEFLLKIFSGQYLLIEEKEPGEKTRKTIEDDLDAYLKWLPKNSEYNIFNKT